MQNYQFLEHIHLISTIWAINPVICFITKIINFFGQKFHTTWSCFLLLTSTHIVLVDQPSNPEYNNFSKYGARGTRNIYVSVIDSLTNKTISLGAWHVLPESLISASEATTNYDFDEALSSGTHPVIIYFHGNSGTRIAPLNTYLVLRKFFHVIAFDYRRKNFLRR